MLSSSTRLIEALARIPALLDGALQVTDTAARATRLAESLHTLWPAAGLSACRLEGTGRPAVHALDHAGKAREKWAVALETPLAPHGTDAADPPASSKPPAPLRLSGHTLHLAPIAWQGRCLGTLALATPPETAAADVAAARALLDNFADRVALRLQLEQAKPQGGAAETELQELIGAADVAEAYSVFLHELGNVLNNLVLDVRLLEREIPESARGRLTEIGRLAGSVPSLVTHLTRYRQARRPRQQPVDLNDVAARVVAKLAQAGAAVQAELAPDLPPVPGTPVGMGRLVRLLLTNALAVTPPSALPVRLRTEPGGEGVRLFVEDGGPPVPEGDLPHLFEPFTTTREGQNNLELAICKALLRRLFGTLEASNRPEGGVTFLAELPVYEDTHHAG